MPVYVGRWRKLVYASRFLTRLKPVNTACRHKLANPGLNVTIFHDIFSYMQSVSLCAGTLAVKLQNFHLGELRTGCEARVVYETRRVEAGTGATPHTAIFSLAPGKRQIQPASLPIPDH